MESGIAIIGGGASGLMAAVSAAELGQRVTILEGGERVGKKLLATGSGRCNITNTNCVRTKYHGAGASDAFRLIRRFPPEKTLEFFEKLGLFTTEEYGGRVYPVSGTASSVLDVLRLACEHLGAEVISNFKAVSVRKHGDILLIKSCDGREYTADRVIVAAGGMAGAKFGCDGSGYKLTDVHKCTRLIPSLVQLKSDNRELRPLSGLRVNARVTACGAETVGEVLFTDFGLSGPAVFDVSRACASACAEAGSMVLEIDFLPETGTDGLMHELKRRCTEYPERTMEDFLIGIFHRRIGFSIVKSAGISPLSIKCGALTEKQIRLLAETAKHFKIKVSGTLSWQHAQVTAGGIEFSGIDKDTLESLYIPGLYFCGEVLDVDGDCGGYNLQWAWTSGRIAGLSAAESLKINSK